mmetsp:Transcript_17710/g.37206  ORF Transcript_17710/g.37206 Transcript_17710/m.37206 type:complete len:242 (-) Transcript_17710:384-1109(-)
MISCPVITHAFLETLHGFDVVSIHIQPRRGYERHQIQIPSEIRSQSLDDNSPFLLPILIHGHITPPLFQILHHPPKMPRPLILQIIPIHTSQHDIIQTPTLDRLGHLLRLLFIQWGRLPRSFHGAKRTSPGTRISHDHNGGGGSPSVSSFRLLFFGHVGVFFAIGVDRFFLRGSPPTLSDVGTFGLLADGGQTEGTDGISEFVVFRRGGGGGFEPFGFGEDFGGARWGLFALGDVAYGICG